MRTMPATIGRDGMTERPRLARTVTVLQMVGSLLAIPVGLGSAYSIYHANFSPESACQTLRANIVSMLDKSVDAATRRHAGAPRRRDLRENLRRGRPRRDGGVQDLARDRSR